MGSIIYREVGKVGDLPRRVIIFKGFDLAKAVILKLESASEPPRRFVKTNCWVPSTEVLIQ